MPDKKKTLFEKLEVVLTAPSRFLGQKMEEFATSPVAEKLEVQLPKTLTGIAEAPVTLATGISAFPVAMASQIGKTVIDKSKDAISVLSDPMQMATRTYDAWKSGFRKIGGGEEKGILGSLGENIGVFDDVMQTLSVQPKTEEGAHIVDVAMAPLSTFEKSLDVVGDKMGMTPEQKNGLKTLGRVAYGKLYRTGKSYALKGANRIAEVAQGRPKGIEVTSDTTPRMIEDASSINRDFAHMSKLEKSAMRRPRKIKQALTTALVDASGNVKSALYTLGDRGYDIARHHDLVKGSTPRINMLVDDAKARLTKGLSTEDVKLLNEAVVVARELGIERYKPGSKHPLGWTPEKMVNRLWTMPERILERADEYGKIMKEMTIDRKLAEGLISKEEHTALASKGLYSPRQLLDKMRTETQDAIPKPAKESVASSGIQELKRGSTKEIRTNAIGMLFEEIASTDIAIARNRVGKGLYRVATNTPENGLASVVHPKKYDTPPPRGYDYVFSMIDGKKRAVQMKSEFANELVKSDPYIAGTLAKVLSWTMGSPILRAQATGYNPYFAAKNVFRDTQLIWLASDEYSHAIPFAIPQMAQDIATVLPDAISRKGRYRDYIQDGGGMGLLTHQGQIAPTAKGVFGGIQKYLGYLNETSEIMTRLALRERALKNGKSRQEASHVARDYLDFSQGGNMAKAVDTAVPYLNAAIQATRGVLRSAKRDPFKFALKASQILMLSQGLYLANKEGYGDRIDEVKKSDRINNWIIFTPVVYKDQNGVEKQHYIKIPKDQTQRLLSTMFEGMIAKATGDKNFDYSMIPEAAKQALPFIPTEGIPPTMEAYFTYMYNKDFWLNEDVWKGTPQADATEEYTRFTPPAWVEGTKALKGATGIEVSPERLRSALSTVFSRNNLYNDLVGMGANKVFGELPENQRTEVSNDILRKSPFIRDFLGSTDPRFRLGEEVENIGLEENTRRTKQNREVDELSAEFYEQKKLGAKPPINSVKEYILRQPSEDDRERLYNRFINHDKTKGISNGTWWRDISSLPPEPRAEAFYLEWSRKDEEGKRALEKTAGQLSGFGSARFKAKFKELTKGYKKSDEQTGEKLEIIWK